jgi:hypothetical protein
MGSAILIIALLLTLTCRGDDKLDCMQGKPTII